MNEPREDDPSDEQVIADTRRWLERAVIGLNLCPFAKAEHVNRRIRYVVSPARGIDELLDELQHELLALEDADPLGIETTLLMHPHVLREFLDYNDFLDDADALTTSLPGRRRMTSATSATARPFPRCTCCARPASSAPCRPFPKPRRSMSATCAPCRNWDWKAGAS